MKNNLNLYKDIYRINMIRNISDIFKDFILHNEDIKPIIEQIQTESTLDYEIWEFNNS